MKKIFLIALVSWPVFAAADIYKFTDADGRVYYSPEPKPGYVRVVKSLTPQEYAALLKEDARRANQAYQDKVNETAKFLDDVEAARRRRKQH